MQLDSSIHAPVTLFAGLNILDIASTSLALRVGLPEGNQIPSMLLAGGGEAAMYLFKAAIALLIIVAAIRLSPYYRRLGRGLQLANVFLTVTVLFNLVQLFIL